MRTLSVNLDHVATLREARKTNYPSLTTAAGICEVAGADGVTIHLRGDRRHIQDRDLEIIRQITLLPLTLEMAPTEEMLNIAIRTKPDAVTLVPERRMEITTEGGLDPTVNQTYLYDYIQKLKKHNIKVCLFLEPEQEHIKIAKELGVDAVEIHTGKYSVLFDKFHPEKYEDELKKIRDSAYYGKSIGLQMNAGHGIHYQNVKPLAKIQEISEFSIGHAIISRAIFVGLERAIKEMIELIHNP
ncbi:MAG: pyridoxine 5'-phosphate synthase [Leptospiraceae bacterium]|nr:pyridoxine 5'-phosphate synthase [Leptospiraceae bacterium]MDW7976600.1 pyridoxine 5'-phosphate synthase [Leptospiraceae bacterium]